MPRGAAAHRAEARSIGADHHRVAKRSHPLRPDIDLDTHILDVVNVVKWQELSDVALVGYSYGGMVITGVAENLEKAIASSVMLEAFFPSNAQSVADVASPAAVDTVVAAERAGATVLP